MESKGKRTSAGASRSKLPLPKTVEEYLTLDAERFALFLVGKGIEVQEEADGEDPLSVKGIVRRVENSEKENKDDPDQMQIHHSNWQVSIMSAEKHREYTYNVLDFVHPDGRPYQTQKRVVRGEPGGPLEPVEKNITLKVVDYSDKRAEATFMYKERHFLGGCLHGQETIKSGVAHLKNEAVCVWWPGERSWFKGRVAGTISKARQFDIEYDDGEIWNNKGFTTMATTEDNLENGTAAMAFRSEGKATEARAKSTAAKAEGGTKKKSPPAAKGGKEQVSKKRKASQSGKKEYNPAGEEVVLDIGDVIVMRDKDNMMRLTSKSLPAMKKMNKNCKAETPGPECAIFTIEEGAKKPKHTVNVVVTKHNVESASLNLQGEVWNLDWGLEPKKG